jgi:hypothetical protein
MHGIKDSLKKRNQVNKSHLYKKRKRNQGINLLRVAVRSVGVLVEVARTASGTDLK